VAISPVHSAQVDVVLHCSFILSPQTLFWLHFCLLSKVGNFVHDFPV